MKSTKFYAIIIGLLLVFFASVFITSIRHPILLKWVVGTARLIGEPIPVTVYTNGIKNNDIKVFHVDKYWGNDKKANNYLLHITAYNSISMLEFLNINLLEKWIGSPVGTSKVDYDYFIGHLFQSETGGHFIPFEDGMKSFAFDPQLSFSDSQIKFNIPPNTLKFDSVRIELKYNQTTQ